MKVVQCVGWYFPEQVGGSEVYVAGLAAGLRQRGVDSVIAAPLDGDLPRQGQHEGFAVMRYPVPAGRTPEQLRGETPHARFDLFRQWLSTQDAQVYHQHSWTFGCGPHHLRAAKEQGLATVLTIHVPGPVCLRGTMMRNGEAACDGRIEASRCAECWLRSRGMPAALARPLAWLPPAVGDALPALGAAGTALAATSLVARHRAALMQAAGLADRVVAVCGWLHEALLANGVDSRKLVLNRQGVTTTAGPTPFVAPRAGDGPLRVGFIGRWDPTKGLAELLQAWAGLPAGTRASLEVRAPEPHDAASRAFRSAMQARAAQLPGVRIGAPLAPSEVPAFLASLDVLAVPSQWMETGPLVVLEAFAARTPVLGADLGGIAELVHHDVDGWLLEPRDTDAWTQALHALATDRARLERWRTMIGPVRTMNDVAADMEQVYASLLPTAETRR